MASIFEEIGGTAAVTAVVDDLYDRVLEDPRLRGYFAHTDMDRLKAHQREFVAAALGGPDAYQGRAMRDAHAGLGVTPEHFDAVVAHLTDSLRAHGVRQEALASIGTALAPLKLQITAGRFV